MHTHQEYIRFVTTVSSYTVTSGLHWQGFATIFDALHSDTVTAFTIQTDHRAEVAAVRNVRVREVHHAAAAAACQGSGTRTR